ncbi:GntR family transcriptional regulator [Clostridium chromiireducens]|uniref:GntR family transcriptional regulator n=1 Tax=Clostridium chromiireducens TaxID=225345 RepID=A0A1V4IHA3_9CLOT|nr:GntR family transcriptional regulator [Clostridium chromiireducens]OPJ59306.1 HTH-type transcriptional regulator LutR [Clostridium chromiireducens]RII33405.1 GntR family transcriptional regulator [Clostridium chromiireducens]
MENYKIEKGPSYFDQAYTSIKDMIFNGILKPGDRIYESKIASEFQISRSPVREAIRSLEKDGLILISDKSKITVYQPTKEDIENIYECRQALESQAVRLTTRKASDSELERIEATLFETQKNIENFDDKLVKTLILLNTQFHDLILNYSQNNRLRKQSKDLSALTYFYRSIDIYEHDRIMDIFNYHLKIFHYIKQRNEEKAGETMYNHIGNDLKHLEAILSIESII